MSGLESVIIDNYVVKRMDTERVKIYIDLDNLEKGARERYPLYYVEIDYQKLASRLIGCGVNGGVNVFDGTYRNGEDPRKEVHENLRNLGFEVSLRVSNKEKRYDYNGLPQIVFVQKGVDGALMTQLLKDCYNNQFDTAVILSADRDFNDAALAVREAGKTVECATFNDGDFTFKRICNKYCDLDYLDVVQLYTKNTHTPVTINRTAAGVVTVGEINLEEPVSEGSSKCEEPDTTTQEIYRNHENNMEALY